MRVEQNSITTNINHQNLNKKISLVSIDPPKSMLKTKLNKNVKKSSKFFNPSKKNKDNENPFKSQETIPNALFFDYIKLKNRENSTHNLYNNSSLKLQHSNLSELNSPNQPILYNIHEEEETDSDLDTFSLDSFVVNYTKNEDFGLCSLSPDIEPSSTKQPLIFELMELGVGEFEE
ncbi:hypothetical protein HDU92_001623 [Lobulomyces angularis]|nr:hypothetical protein HDU92_001623 [Lobulomyces angularis]